MDLAKTLIRSVARAFYETKHVLVIDALMIHSVLPNEDLAHLLGMQQKDLRKLCGKLKEDRLLTVHSRQESREGQQRPISKEYYFVDFHATIDAIKYRVFHMTEKVKQMYKPNEEKKDYHCPKCNAQWTQLEVLDRVGPMGFECHRCDGLLEREEPNAGDSTGHEKQSRLMGQLEGLLKMLRRIDSEDIPKNDFDTAFSLAVPIQRDETTNPLRQTVPVDVPKGPPTAVKGLTQVVAAPLDVSLTTSTEKTAAEQAAEAKRKAEIAAQNVLPVWHTTSTVTGESTVTKKIDGDQPIHNGNLSKDEEVESKNNPAIEDQLSAYYAQMRQEEELKAKEDLEADESSEEDEANDFENVDIDASENDATPSSSMSADMPAQQPPPNGSQKHKRSESGSSAALSASHSPTASGLVVEEDGPVAKKVKFQESLENGIIDAPDTVVNQEKESDEDDDVEFEDLM